MFSAAGERQILPMHTKSTRIGLRAAFIAEWIGAAMFSVLRVLTMAILAVGAVWATDRPNVLVMMSADQGWGELSSASHPQVRTPRLDRLREEGMDFRRMIAAPTGAATRAQLFSGLHEFRCGVSHTLAGRNLVRPEITLLPEIFRQAGYRTAIIGRWGLGDAYPHRPEDRGFEEFWVNGGHFLGQTSDFWGNTNQSPRVRTQGGWVPREGHVTAVWAAEAKRYLAARATDGQPFFLHLGFTVPHAPYEAPPGAAERFTKAGVPEPAASFHALIEDLDAKVGDVLDELARLKLDDSTIVVFLGDNGPALATLSSGLKGLKGSPDEGGVRVPAFIRWPAKIAAKQQYTALMGVDDLFPTIVGMCGLAQPTRPCSAARDVSGFLLGKAESPAKRSIFTHVGCWSGDDRPERHRSVGFAVREGDWVLSGLELCDVAKDPGQRNNLFEREPEVATRMLADYGVWWSGIQATVRDPVRYVVGDVRQPVVRLNASEWWPSREVGGAVGAEGLASQTSVRRLLEEFQAGGPVPETSGLWKLRVARDGHYRIKLSMLPDEAPRTEIDRLGQLKPGMVHLRTGPKELQMEVVKGATAVTLRLDLAAGELDLEALFSGQLQAGRILGALFAEIERVGDRKRPEFDFDFEVKPKK